MLLWKTLFVRRWYLGIFLVGALGAVLYVMLDLVARPASVDIFLKRQQTLARAQASNLTSFFQVFGDSIVVLAKSNSIKSRSPEAIQDLDSFVEQWRDSGLVGGVILTDTKGTVILNSNILGTNDVGVSLSHRESYIWATSEGSVDDYFIGKPVISLLGASKGQAIIPVAAKVYQNGVFRGVVIASVKLVPLVTKYLELMKISESTDIYLVAGDGEILYSNNNITESNIVDKLPYLKGRLSTKVEDKFNIGDRLIAQSPVILDDQSWLFVMDSPASDITEVTQPVRIRQTGFVLLVFLTILTLMELYSRGLLKFKFQKRL